MSYAIAGETTLAAAPAAVVGWLTEAELMDRWMLGVDGIVVLDEGHDTPALGPRIQVFASSGRHAGWTFTGELLEVGVDRVVRRYGLDEIRAGGVALEADTSTYVRTVTYTLTMEGGAATRLSCRAEIVIPGLDEPATVKGAAAEEKTLRRSLERLEAEVAGRQRGIIGKFRDVGQAPSPL